LPKVGPYTRQSQPSSVARVSPARGVVFGARVHRLVGRIAPRDFASLCSEDQRVAQCATLVLCASSAMLLFFTLWFLWVDVTQALICLTFLLACIAGLVAVRRGYARRAMNVLLFGTVIAADMLTLLTGGPESATPTWMPLLPILALMMFPLRIALWWTALFVVNQLVLLLCFQWGWHSFALVPGGERRFSDFLLNFTLAPLAAGLFCLWSSAARDEITEKLNKARSVLQMVLQEVPTGFFALDRSGRLTQSPFFGALPISRTLAIGDSLTSMLYRADPKFAARFALGFEALVEEVMPVELLLEQMPTRWTHAGRTLEFRYFLAIEHADQPWSQISLTLRDVTDRLHRERVEDERDVLVRIVHLLQSDRDALFDFVSEADRQFALLRVSTCSDGWLRALHTLKGNAAVFGLTRLSDACHEAEQIALAGSRQHALQLADRAWLAWRSVFEELTDDGGFDGIQIDERALQVFATSLEAGVTNSTLLQQARLWTYRPVRVELERIATRAAAVAERLNKPAPTVVVDAHDERVDGDRWRPLWAALIHVVRNAVDHGIEAPAERLRAGKKAHGTIAIRCALRQDTLLIEIADDGGGIDWPSVRESARECGLPVDGHRSLEWLLADGVSTRTVADEMSGRGVGLAAFADAVWALNGEVDVKSKPGRGTTWRLSIPKDNMHALPSKRHHTTMKGMPIRFAG
jgi:HPt (histidine-containing phosphotransfer) domain-containing protein/anti-sigma regulatory factor (Ser/Thr protein kinase)